MRTEIVNRVIYVVCACGKRRALAGGYSAEDTPPERARKAAERVGWREVNGEMGCPECVEKWLKKWAASWQKSKTA